MKKTLVLILTLMLLCAALPAQAAGDSLQFDRSVTTLFEGEALQTSLLREGDAANGEVSYVSSAPHNATVDANGLVTGVSKGKTTITATVKTEKRSYRATITLTVARRTESVQVNEQRLTVLDASSPLLAQLLPQETEETLPVLLLRLGANQAVQATCLPQDATDRRTEVASSDEAIVRVQGATLIPQKAGSCVVTVSSRQNPEVAVSYRAVVVQPVSRLNISAPEKTVYVGQTLTLTPEYTPDNASVQAVTWLSANEKAAVVDENGVVTGVARGSATIRATAADGSGRSVGFTVQVLQQPTSITLKDADITVNMGSYKTLSATVLPKNANDKKVEWLSSDESIATVNAGGRVTPVAPGVCTITCRSRVFPDVTAQARVEVHQLVTKIAFAQKETDVNVGAALQVFWQVSPQNATNAFVTLTSSNDSVATVDQDGTIHGHKRGTATITATAADGSGKRAKLKVNVHQPVEGVHMKNDTIRVGVDEAVTAQAVLEPSNASNTRMTWTSADTSIATVKGSRNKPTITGKRWGDTTITGVTEDGRYSTTAVVKVGNYDKALKITDLYLQDNRIKMTVQNESNMTVTRFYFTVSCYDASGAPLVCTESGSNTFEGSYRLTLYEDDVTEHGRFGFGDYVQPEGEIARVTMQITGYRTDEGYSRDIRENRQIVVEYRTNSYTGTVQ